MKIGDRVFIRQLQAEGEVVPFLPPDKYFDPKIFVRVRYFLKEEGQRKPRKCSKIFYQSDLDLLIASLF